MSKRGILFSQMAPPPEWREEFERWYDEEHIPVRMAVPGFSHAIRYQTDSDPWHLACYFLNDMDALKSPEYKAVKTKPSERTAEMLDNVTGFTRYICDEISDTSAPEEDNPVDTNHALFVVAFNVPEAEAEEFNDWYETEHIPLLMEVPGWRRVRRYKVRPGFEGPEWTHLALHEIDNQEVLANPKRDAARNTPWRDKLAARSWFSSGRWVYDPIAAFQSVEKG